MATAFWYPRLGKPLRTTRSGRAKKRVILIRWKDAAGIWQQKVAKGCTRIADAQELANDLQRKAVRQQKGFEEADLPSRLTLGMLLDRWWLQAGSLRQSDSKEEY